MKKLLVVLGISLFVVLGVNILLPSASYAVPSFARAMNPCSACHTQWPLLNEFGRAFLAQGFQRGEELDISDTMTLPKDLPVSVRLNFRLIDKRTSKDKIGDLTAKDKQLKIRSLHEAELFVAGKFNDISYFLEFEAEDEFDNEKGFPGFQVQLAKGYAGWNLNPAFNLRAGLTSPFGADGRNTVFRHKPGRYEWAASAEGFVPGESQVVSVHGNDENLFYILAWHGNDEGDGQLEGKDPRDFSARLAYDFAGGSIGGFYTTSKAFDDTTGRSEDRTNRYGIDAQWLHQGIQVNAIYAVKDVDVGDVGDMKDNLIGLFAQYILSKDNSPWCAVALNFDRFSGMDGEEFWTKGAIFLTLFGRGNVKIQTGWEGTFDAPDAYDHKESRFTLVVDLGI